jgi:squalene synthase HpnC
MNGSLTVATRGELRAADAYCRSLTAHHYENFSVASVFLPAETRLHLARLYAYCRITDDLGDESGAEAIPRLAAWQQQVEQCLDGGPDPIHPVLLALRQTIIACRLPSQPFLDLIAANIQDQMVSEYGTWAELISYCHLSAAPVGRLVLGIWGIEGAEAEKLSDDVCIGLQLANFAQDVAVDRMKLRTYLVQADIARYGVEGAIRSLCDRAEGLLASGQELERLVGSVRASGRSAPRSRTWCLQVQLALYRLGGLAIISAIQRIDYRTDRRRPHLPLMTKLGLIITALAESKRSNAYVSQRAA